MTPLNIVCGWSCWVKCHLWQRYTHTESSSSDLYKPISKEETCSGRNPEDKMGQITRIWRWIDLIFLGASGLDWIGLTHLITCVSSAQCAWQRCVCQDVGSNTDLQPGRFFWRGSRTQTEGKHDRDRLRRGNKRRIFLNLSGSDPHPQFAQRHLNTTLIGSCYMERKVWHWAESAVPKQAAVTTCYQAQAARFQRTLTCCQSWDHRALNQATRHQQAPPFVRLTLEVKHSRREHQQRAAAHHRDTKPTPETLKVTRWSERITEVRKQSGDTHDPPGESQRRRASHHKLRPAL